MLAVAMLGNEPNVVAIGTYCDNLPLIAMNVVVAIDRNPCSGWRRGGAVGWRRGGAVGWRRAVGRRRCGGLASAAAWRRPR
jgi:hypothetical protein